MNQTTAQEKVQDLINKFHREQAAGTIGQYNESEIDDRVYELYEITEMERKIIES
jgi:hypothetical protein